MFFPYSGQVDWLARGLGVVRLRPKNRMDVIDRSSLAYERGRTLIKDYNKDPSQALRAHLHMTENLPTNS